MLSEQSTSQILNEFKATQNIKTPFNGRKKTNSMPNNYNYQKSNQFLKNNKIINKDNSIARKIFNKNNISGNKNLKLDFQSPQISGINTNSPTLQLINKARNDLVNDGFKLDTPKQEEKQSLFRQQQLQQQQIQKKTSNFKMRRVQSASYQRRPMPPNKKSQMQINTGNQQLSSQTMTLRPITATHMSNRNLANTFNSNISEGPTEMFFKTKKQMQLQQENSNNSGSSSKKRGINNNNYNINQNSINSTKKSFFVNQGVGVNFQEQSASSISKVLNSPTRKRNQQIKSQEEVKRDQLSISDQKSIRNQVQSQGGQRQYKDNIEQDLGLQLKLQKDQENSSLQQQQILHQGRKFSIRKINSNLHSNTINSNYNDQQQNSKNSSDKKQNNLKKNDQNKKQEEENQEKDEKNWENMQIFQNDLKVKVGEVKLGQGGQGTVYQGLIQDSGKFIAVKHISYEHERQNQINLQSKIEDIVKEIEFLKKLQHQNIVKYYGSKFQDYNLYIYLEQMAGGSLQDMIQEYGNFQENIVRVYTKQLLEGLQYLHSQGVVHRDLKCANILCDSSGKIKLSDFGAAKYLKNYKINNSQQFIQNLDESQISLKQSNIITKDSKQQNQSQNNTNSYKLQGSLYWMAPEVFQQ